MAKKKSRKRENGEGSIWQRPTGTWVVTVTIPRSGGQRLHGSAKSRDQAKVVLGALREQAKSMASARGKTPAKTVLELAEMWSGAKDIDQPSKDSHRYALKHIGWLSGVAIQKVTPLMLAEWLADVKGTEEKKGGCRPRTREILCNVIKSTCDYAVDLGLIPSTPFKIAVPVAKPKKVVTFTPAEARMIFAEAAKDRVGGAIILTMCGAFRQGEVFGLRWGDIDWECSEVAVSRQVVQRKGGLQSKAPKTKTSIRRVVLPQVAMDALRARQVLAMAEGRASFDHWVFPSRTGKPMSRSNYGRRHWKPLLERLEIPHRGLHHARHTSLSIMLSQKVAVQEVANVAGHATPTILLDTYAHMLPGTGRAAADAIQNVLGCNAVATPGPSSEKSAS